MGLGYFEPVDIILYDENSGWSNPIVLAKTKSLIMYQLDVNVCIGILACYVDIELEHEYHQSITY